MGGAFNIGGIAFKVAFASSDNAGNLFGANSNIDSVTHVSPGEYLFDYTSAGFQSVPAALASVFGNGSIRYVTTDILNATTTTCTIFTWDDLFTQSDQDFSVLFIGS